MPELVKDIGGFRWISPEEQAEREARRCPSLRTPGSRVTARCEMDKHEDGFHCGRSASGRWYNWHD